MSAPTAPPETAVPHPALPLGVLLRVFLPFAAGFFLSYLFRSVNAAIAPRLVADIALSPADLGLLASAYFLSFGSFQIPLGLLLDRYGPKSVQAVLLVVAAAGSILFSLAEGRTGLIAARLLIGLGVSACLMASFKAFVLWFPKERLPLANGVVLAAGGLGALSATAPVDILAEALGWRWVFAALAGVCLGLSVVVALVVPRPPHSGPPEPPRVALAGVARVFGALRFWHVAPLAIGSQATLLAVQSLWAGPWLTAVAGLDPQEAARALLWVAAAMVAGYLGLGALAERLERRGIATRRVAVVGAVVFMGVQVALLAQPSGSWALVCWILFGFFGTTGILFYAALSQAFPAGLAGRVNTAINLLVFAAAFSAQWGIGAVIEAVPPAPGVAYAPAGFTLAFAGLLVIQALALVWLWIAGGMLRRQAAEPAPAADR